MRSRIYATFIAVIGASCLSAADATLPDGNWQLSYGASPLNLNAVCVIKTTTKDGKTTAEVVDSRVGFPATFDSFTVKDQDISIVLKGQGLTIRFDGIVNPKSPNEVKGFFGDDRLSFKGFLKATMSDKVEARVTPPEPPKEYAEYRKLASDVVRALQAQRTATTEEEKEKATKDLADAQQKQKSEGSKFLTETIAKHADSPYAAIAADELLTLAPTSKASIQDVTSWMNLLLADAKSYGSVFSKRYQATIAEKVVGMKGYEEAALGLLTTAAAELTDKDDLNVQARLYKSLAKAQTAAGKKADAAKTTDKLVAIEKKLDDEYKEKVPPFKPAMYAGRQAKDANKVAVMELFTGAQCPPCVAADVGFDALEKAYKHQDLVLIQYHMHIPGPDPLTNPTSEGRWAYYRKLFPQGVRGTPTTIFNGRIAAAGGGGMAQSQGKFNQYKEVIDEILEESTTVEITGTSSLKGDDIAVNVNIKGLKGLSKELKIRVLVVEESIRYVGGNQLRFHHQVVRAALGGVEGKSVTGDTFNGDFTGKISEIKTELEDYLTNFSRPFPNPDRPMDLVNLKAIVLVQDDVDGRIIQAQQFDLKAGK
ncbi:MAG: hypothetical protein R3B84_05210 [Zavarzinella sp.]